MQLNAPLPDRSANTPARSRKRTPLFALIVMAVLIAFVLIAVLLAPRLTDGGGPQRPSVTLATPTLNMGTATVDVAEMSSAASPTKFRLNVELNGTPGMSVPMPDSNNGTVTITSAVTSSINFTVRWTDANGDGELSVRDYFTISQPGGLPHPGSYVFYLLWDDGVPVASVSFATV